MPVAPPTRHRITLTPPQAVHATTVTRWVGDGDDGRAPAVVLAHGAGSGPESDVLVAVAEALAARGSPVSSFAFGYHMAGRRSPDPPRRLLGAWRDVLAAERALVGAERPVVLGGRSMGGRMASMLVADGEPAAGLLLLAYPLHPAGRREKLRTDHWPRLHLPVLFVSGDRDALCDPARFAHARTALDDEVTSLHVIAGADHGFRTPRRGGRARGDVLGEIAGAAAAWVGTLA